MLTSASVEKVFTLVKSLDIQALVSVKLKAHRDLPETGGFFGNLERRYAWSLLYVSVFSQKH